MIYKINYRPGCLISSWIEIKVCSVNSLICPHKMSDFKKSCLVLSFHLCLALSAVLQVWVHTGMEALLCYSRIPIPAFGIDQAAQPCREGQLCLRNEGRAGWALPLSCAVVPCHVPPQLLAGGLSQLDVACALQLREIQIWVIRSLLSPGSHFTTRSHFYNSISLQF